MSADGQGAAPVETAAAALGIRVTAESPCSGGDINRAFRLELADGRSAFLKCRTGADVEEFADEAAGLGWLAQSDAIAVPDVLALIEDERCPGLILEWVEPGPALSASGEADFGRCLALLHLSGASFHGEAAPGASAGGIRLGDAVLVPARSETAEFAFPELYAMRLEALVRQALSVGGIDPQGAAQVSRLAAGIESFSGPPVAPARLHGDLWSGNVMADTSGKPVLIDPAPYGGHPEMDLAMLDLFGSVARRFMDAYEEVAPLPDGAGERRLLWQIQPLLVHAVLFGGHYGPAAARAARHYTGR